MKTRPKLFPYGGSDAVIILQSRGIIGDKANKRFGALGASLSLQIYMARDSLKIDST